MEMDGFMLGWVLDARLPGASNQHTEPAVSRFCIIPWKSNYKGGLVKEEIHGNH